MRATGCVVRGGAAILSALGAFGLPAAINAPAQPGGEAAPVMTVAALASDGRPATVDVSSRAIYQGGSALIEVTSAVSGSATVLGRTTALESTADGSLAAFLGVGVVDPPGTTMLTITVTDRWGETFTQQESLVVLPTDWTVDYIILPPGVGGGLSPEIVRAEEDLLAATYGGETPPAWSGAWVGPIDLSVFIVTGYFGEQRSFNGGPVSGHHGGTDFGTRLEGPPLDGTTVGATNSGTVVLAQALAVRGNMVIVDHGGGVFSGYAHLQRIDVVPGQKVSKGQGLGAVGTTGLSTGPHLHWEVAVGGILVDGLRWLDGTQGF